MASEYLKWLARNERPQEKRELTKAEKRRNWWDYHKWHVVLGVILLLIAVDIGKDVLGIGRVQPDLQVAYVGANPLPEDTLAALEEGLAALLPDLNGDGEVAVTVHDYASLGSADPNYAYAAQVQLMGDMESGESYLFLLEDPEQFQQNYRILQKLDGSLPAEDDGSARDTYYLWKDCPALAGMKLGSFSYSVAGQTVTGDSQALLENLAVARRGFWPRGGESEDREPLKQAWQTLTEGAAP